VVVAVEHSTVELVELVELVAAVQWTPMALQILVAVVEDQTIPTESPPMQEPTEAQALSL
jgi:hypothetical protein